MNNEDKLKEYIWIKAWDGREIEIFKFLKNNPTDKYALLQKKWIIADYDSDKYYDNDFELCLTSEDRGVLRIFDTVYSRYVNSLSCKVITEKEANAIKLGILEKEKEESEKKERAEYKRLRAKYGRRKSKSKNESK